MLLSAPAPVWTQTAAGTITVAAARAASARRGGGRPVSVRGTVTVRDAVRNLLFVQDDTGGIFIMPATVDRSVTAGTVVDVRGKLVYGGRGPAITDAVVVSRGTVDSRVAQPLSAFAQRLPEADGRLVEARGVVRRLQLRGASVEVALQTAEGPLTWLQADTADRQGLQLDAVVLATGVLSQTWADTSAPRRRELIAARPVRVEVAPFGDPFDSPAVRVESLPREGSFAGLHRRVTISGVVTRQRAGRSLYLRTPGGPLYVESDTPTLAAIGDSVEVAGFPAVGEFSPFLADAVFRVSSEGPAPEPVVATLAALADGSLDGELVRVDATYLGGAAGREQFTLVLQDGDVAFNAPAPLESATGLGDRLQVGARLSVTGVCSVVIDSERRPLSFRVLLRDEGDVTVVAPATPVTPVGAPRWAWVSLVVALAAMVAAGVCYRRNQAQEETIRRQLARESSLKARFDDLFERSSEILIVHDRRGRVSTLNRAGEQATGYAREEMRMLDPAWIFGSDYLDAITRMLDEGVDAAPRALRSELVPRSGKRVPVDVRARVLIGDGRVVGVTSIARDLTDRDRLEDELRQAQKMEAVGRLATGIAHDFNNLITVLLGYSDELIEVVADGSEQQRAAREIRRAAGRASGLTQQLLAFSRRQASVSQSVNVNAIVSNMEELIQRLIGTEIKLNMSLAGDLAPIRADAAQIGQVLMNLAVNARDATTLGGELRIETANVDLGAENVDIIPGPHVMLAVHDTGIGMTAEVQEHLFEPFFTTKDTGQGTGLGLSMIQAIVRQSGGHIAVDSTPGKGSTFRVYFPVQGELAEAVAPAPTPLSVGTVKGSGVVLFAEDDSSVRRLVTLELRRRGFTVLDAEAGRAALELFAENQDRVDVLVTDVVMPRMNGSDLAIEVEKMRPGTKILFISGHPERAGRGLDPTGVTNLLMKPFTADVLAARIKDIIAGEKGAEATRV